MKISVIGGGAWSTAMSKLLVENGHEVTLCVRKVQDMEKLKNLKENKKHLAGIKLPANLKYSTFERIPKCDVALFGVPAQHVREVLNAVNFEAEGIVNLAKGIEIKTLKRMEEVFKEYFPFLNYATLSGPNHAEEVAVGIPTSTVVSSRNSEFSRRVQMEFSSEVFRVYTNDDLTGVELGGALKNVIAIAAGVIDGLGGWDNTKAALITRGLAEMARIGKKMGAKLETFMGLSGLGDLVVTCTSRHSRNRLAGEMLGRGGHFDNESAFVVEGAYTVVAELKLSERFNEDLPIAYGVYSMIYEKKDPVAIIEDLMKRPLKGEWNFSFFSPT